MPETTLRSPKVRNALLLLVGNGALVQGLGIISGILMARLLGAEGRGDVATVMFWPTFVSSIANFSLHNAATYHSAKHSVRFRTAVIGTINTLSIAASSAGVLLATFCVVVFVSDPSLARYAIIASLIYVPADILRVIFIGQDAGFGNYRWVRRLRIVGPVAYVSCLVCLAVLDLLSVSNAAISAALAVAAAAGFRVAAGPRVTLRFMPRIAREVIRTSGRFYPAQIVETARSHADRLVLVTLFPSASIGVYVLATTFASAPLGILGQAVNLLLFPRVSGQKSMVRKKHLVTDTFRLAALLATFVLPILLVIIPFMITLLLGVEFYESTAISQILLIGFSFRFLYQILMAGVRGYRDTKIQGYTHGVGLLSFVLIVLAFHGAGIVGIAIATAASFVVSFGFALYLFRQIHSIALRDFWPYNRRTLGRAIRLGKRMGASVASGLARSR